MLYLIGPMHGPLNSLLHNTSHAINSYKSNTNSFAIDDENSTHSLEDHHTHAKTIIDVKTLAIKEYDEKHENRLEFNHVHEFIDFVYSLLDTSGSNDIQDPMFSKIKIDKHLAYSEYHQENNMVIQLTQLYWEQKTTPQEGYLTRLDLPPKPHSVSIC